MRILLSAKEVQEITLCDDDTCYCDCDDCGCDWDSECSGEGTPID